MFLGLVIFGGVSDTEVRGEEAVSVMVGAKNSSWSGALARSLCSGALGAIFSCHPQGWATPGPQCSGHFLRLAAFPECLGPRIPARRGQLTEQFGEAWVPSFLS